MYRTMSPDPTPEELRQIATNAAPPWNRWPRWVIDLDVDLGFRANMIEDEDSPLTEEEKEAERRTIDYARDALRLWVSKAYPSDDSNQDKIVTGEALPSSIVVVRGLKFTS